MGSGGQGPDNPNTLGIKLIHGLKNEWIVRPLTKIRNDNPTRIIASCGRTAVENLLIFVEKCLFPDVLKVDTRMQDTQHMLDIIDDYNRNGNLHENCLLVSFDVVNMFPNSKWELNQWWKYY